MLRHMSLCSQVLNLVDRRQWSAMGVGIGVTLSVISRLATRYPLILPDDPDI
jgi:hypothetical protein